MSVDQTSQLIQLVLNSVLMMALCGGVSIGLMVRQSAIVSQIRLLKPIYSDALNGVRLLPPERFVHTKNQMRRLRRHYRLACLGCWSANGALVLCTVSTLLLALRTLVLLDRLIPISLLLFTLGVAALLISLVLGLLSLVGANPVEPAEPRADPKEPKSGRSRVPLQEPIRLSLRPALKDPLPNALSWSDSEYDPTRSPYQGNALSPRPQSR